MRLAILVVAVASWALAGCRPSPKPIRPRSGAALESVTAPRGQRPDVSHTPLEDVLRRHTPSLLAIPGVIGTGEGEEMGRPTFVIFVRKRTPELDARLPRAIEGYAVTVRETGDVTAPPR
jgi:hypothetical protein